MKTPAKTAVTFLAAILALGFAGSSLAGEPNKRRGQVYFKMVCTQCHVQTAEKTIPPNARSMAEWDAYMSADRHDSSGSSEPTVSFYTSSAYREITAQIEPVLLGTEIAPGPIARDETLVLWLLETTRTATPEALASMSHSAREFGGQLIWSVPVAVLEGERSWNYLLLLAFPDPGAVQTWLTDPETATDRTLARRLYVEEAIMELSAN